MRVSGNGNAREFFKKHGVTDAQMGSEKKYSSKAAPEYLKHLQKLLHEGPQTLRSRSRSEDVNDNHAKGLDGLINSLSMNSSATAAPVSAPAPVQAAAQETIFRVSPTPVVPKGTLNISHAVTPEPVEEETVSVEDAAAAHANAASADALKLHKLGAKKPAASKKAGLGARKIVTNTPSDVRIESFESVEKRAAVAQQEVEDRKLAQQLQVQEAATASLNASSGRVAAMMAESEGSAKQSIYRTAPTTSTSGKTASTASNGYRAPASSTNKSTFNKSAPESTQARDKYSSQKGISSDQYFGRDQEDPAVLASRLGQYSNSSAISSDMMYGRGGRSGSYDDNDEDGSATLEKLKDSVAGFFDSFK
eukprot:CAMPEP_0184981414 /NCGR_PEP_ID=MMETSP1098-20130426/11143_1 /TAXON_ID=89044 /ORGANISM="Spumella elongata, Strain CCAP 955/1" /LENGTH=363 /DNA_ID=CAMNT_0027504973 /DNA_START=359 /DNA_END=1450 /DNA_ORIENTATION=+